MLYISIVSCNPINERNMIQELTCDMKINIYLSMYQFSSLLNMKTGRRRTGLCASKTRYCIQIVVVSWLPIHHGAQNIIVDLNKFDLISNRYLGYTCNRSIGLVISKWIKRSHFRICSLVHDTSSIPVINPGLEDDPVHLISKDIFSISKFCFILYYSQCVRQMLYSTYNYNISVGNI